MYKHLILNFIHSLCFILCITIDPDDLSRVTEKTRVLGLVVCRGTQVALISPSEGMEEIANPFVDGDEEIEVAEG